MTYKNGMKHSYCARLGLCQGALVLYLGTGKEYFTKK